VWLSFGSLDGKPQMKLLRKILYGLLMGFCSAVVVAFIWIHLSYSSNLPTAPDEKSGHIYRMVVNHGFVVYGSEREFRVFRWVENLWPFAIVCGLITFIVALRYGDIKIGPGRKWNE
jgi:hypothetical protein